MKTMHTVIDGKSIHRILSNSSLISAQHSFKRHRNQQSHAKPNPGHLVIVMATSKRQPSRHTPLSQAHRTTSTARLHTTKYTTR